MKFVLGAGEVAAMSSPTSLSAVSWCSEGTTCAWPSRPIWSASQRRLGFAAVGFGPEAQSILDAHREFWTCFFGHPWRIRDLIRSRLEIAGPLVRGWQDMSTTLMSLADGADLIFTGINFEDAAANVAEYYDIPLATLHYFPLRPNGQILRFLPAPLGRSAVTAFWWLSWRGTKKVEDAQRLELGLPKATGSAPRRITERGSLEIQAYDEACFPGLAAEWAE